EMIERMRPIQKCDGPLAGPIVGGLARNGGHRRPGKCKSKGDSLHIPLIVLVLLASRNPPPLGPTLSRKGCASINIQFVGFKGCVDEFGKARFRDGDCDLFSSRDLCTVGARSDGLLLKILFAGGLYR